MIIYDIFLRPAAAVLLGFVIDFFAGDPRWLYHPVRLIGAWISVCERMLRKIFPKTRRGERAAGVLLVLLVFFVSAGVPAAVLALLYHVVPMAGFLLETFWCWQLLAARSLVKESDTVYRELKDGTIESSRRAVSMIVGRDTQSLDEDGVARAAVETVAENTSDGVIAPLIFMMIGGAVWGFAYKAINTMDSMIGYKNEKYQYFGTAAAKLDDVVNFIPARISALVMILAACLLRTGRDQKTGYGTGKIGKKEMPENAAECLNNGNGDSHTVEEWKIYDGRNALRIWRRDRRNHASPNSAQTESAMAGALHIRLAGDAWYFGELYKKPYIGDDDRPIEPEDIRRSHRILWGTAIISLLIFMAIRTMLALIIK